MTKQSFILGLSMLAVIGCNTGEREVTLSDTTTITHTESERPSVPTTEPGTPQPDTQQTTSTTANLPPIATPLPPDRLASFIPNFDGYTAEDLQTETRIRSNIKVSKAWRVFKNGEKKITLTINDFAYVPSQYIPYEQYRGEYLQDDNLERTEATRIGGFETIQTWLKKENRAELTIFPGRRYVVSLIADQMGSVDEARRLAESIDLRGLEGLE